MAPEPPCVRLLVTDFAACFRFYREVLPELSGAALAAGAEDAGYASWDARGVTAFALFDRRFMASALGTDGLPAPAPGGGAQDAAAVVFHLEDAAALDAALERCTAAGAAL
ncbi:hypothetical protein, partial [Streptomyces fuscigenes]|uniref:hypothetical protein n=1 Tax=Streptomyces fuscigenes TaxID=1528880 RepID=UPI001F1BA0A0